MPGVPVAVDGVDVVDVHLSEGPRRRIPATPPEGRPVVDPGEKRKSLYSAVRDDEGFLLRFFGQCDVRLSADLRTAVCHRDPDADDGLVDVLLAGTMLAFVLSLRGTLVLHASAVDVGGRALAFVGHSGMGKSTLTVAACAAGALLVSEDVLAVDTTAVPTCLPGNTDIRLRKGSVTLLDRFNDAPRLRTPDGRHALRPPLTSLPSVPLDTLVIPRPSRTAQRISVDRMPVSPAMFRLINFPRVVGLSEPSVVKRQFEGAGAIARSVPVLVVTVPWGPPFMPDLGEQLIDLTTEPERPVHSR